jgi:hypothetical protein
VAVRGQHVDPAERVVRVAHHRRVVLGPVERRPREQHVVTEVRVVEAVRRALEHPVGDHDVVRLAGGEVDLEHLHRRAGPVAPGRAG